MPTPFSKKKKKENEGSSRLESDELVVGISRVSAPVGPAFFNFKFSTKWERKQYLICFAIKYKK